MLQSSSISAIVVAGGSGTRFGSEKPKQLAILKGRPILSRTIAVFENLEIVDEIILVLPTDWMDVIVAEAVLPFGFTKVRCTAGGASRTESTRRGFTASAGDVVLIHDGVRPLVDPEVVRRVAEAAIATGAALAAAEVRDTLKLASNGLVCRTVDRQNMWQAQTPQGFRREVLAAALADEGAEATDDVGLAESLGLPIALVASTHRNLKITTPEDLAMAEAILSADEIQGADEAQAMIRMGQGYDVHRLVEGRPLFLGCVEIPHDKGLLGHSDADVMAHALVDALLGAAALGDIGFHFPEDPQWSGASGASLLAGAMAKVRSAGFELVNADVTLIGERPKIGPFRDKMKAAVAAALNVPPAAINIKATTTEGLGFTGTGEGLAAMAVASVRAA
ncbi:hypothetical protein C4J81_01470 [Deltaproteobacteria bacterium Smac51]|nr:hypothetical protein C4J81_01470 [Deltaproteobacteria bacterium Smac51]